ncbi:MAG: polysaccharide deacetylase family protein [Pseudomonadota bacterium]
MGGLAGAPLGLRWTARAPLALLLCASLAAPALADVGPATVARADRHLWPETLNSRNGFDKASRASILGYVAVLQQMQARTDADMTAAFKIKSFNRASVDKWLKRELALSLQNYQRAARDCMANDFTCVGAVETTGQLLSKAEAWRTTVPPALAAWSANLSGFAQAYVSEQLRLAALFPKVSSEIDRFDEQREWNGDALEDKQFLLTFDDGPSAAGGSTDDTLAMLAQTKKQGVFFMLGANLQTRAAKTGVPALAAMYKNQCAASHGWEHQSHAKWEQWQDSVKRTQALLNTTFAKADVLPYFRPPYGQRTADSAAFFQQQGLQVALWNLDSQDWNAHVSADDVTNRMIALMLIKRHGVLLFHDIHAKAKSALPVIFDELGSAVEWRDCKRAVAEPVKGG